MSTANRFLGLDDEVSEDAGLSFTPVLLEFQVGRASRHLDTGLEGIIAPEGSSETSVSQTSFVKWGNPPQYLQK